MGLLDYYKQFDDIGESEFNAMLRQRRAREKALALEHVPILDLSSTEWPELPHAEVVGASVYQARGRLNGYPDPEAVQVRRALAERHNIRSSQIVFGNGAAELIRTAVYLLASEGDEVVVPRPSRSRYATIVSRAGARLVQPELPAGMLDAEGVLAAVGPRTRVVVLCNPADPTGTYAPAARIGDLATRLPEHVHTLVDESYVQFQDVEPEDSVMSLVEAFPRLTVLRSFSKIYGLSGVRAGYAVGSAATTPLLSALAPALGVNALTQATVLQALRVGDTDIRRRREAVIEQRKRMLDELSRMAVTVTDSQANFLWIRAHEVPGKDLAARLESSRVRVADGEPLGDADCVRAAIRDRHAADRLLWALREALQGTAVGTSSG
jgi:histidinol-phosphate/aromatic aminotransferase/cobyric acid decarboxylase-like protein